MYCEHVLKPETTASEHLLQIRQYLPCLRLDTLRIGRVVGDADERQLPGDKDQPSCSTAWLNGATGSGAPAIMWKRGAVIDYASYDVWKVLQLCPDTVQSMSTNLSKMLSHMYLFETKSHNRGSANQARARLHLPVLGHVR